MLSSDYFDHPAISRSQLTDLLRSPLHYWAKHVDPQRINVPFDSPALRFGTAVHMAVLEPELFESSYAVGPLASRATKIWKEAQAATTKKLLPPDEMHAIESIVASLRRHQSANKALFKNKGQNEVTYIAELDGLQLKCRADRVLDSGMLIDLKTTQDAREQAFAKSVATFNYHIQAAFYMQVATLATGKRPSGFAFVAVEKEPPYAVQVFRATDQMLEYGDRQVNALLKQLKTVQDEYGTNPWPSYSEQPVWLDLPAWAMK